MRILIALTLLVAGAAASGYGDGYRGGSAYFSVYDLREAEYYLHEVANEKISVRKQIDMIKAQKVELANKLYDLISVKVPEAEAKQQSQNDLLESVRGKIKKALHKFGDIDAQLAGEVAVARRSEDQVSSLSARITELVHINNIQDGQIQKAITTLIDAYEKAVEKLNATRSFARDRVEELKDNTKAYGNLVNAKHCRSYTAHIEIDPETFKGQAYIPLAFNFSGNVPTVTCALQAFETKVNLGKSQAVSGYGGYDERREVLGLSVKCKSFADKILAEAFDQSIGKGNRVLYVYVQAKACALGAQAGVPGH